MAYEFFLQLSKNSKSSVKVPFFDEKCKISFEKIMFFSVFSSEKD